MKGDITANMEKHMAYGTTVLMANSVGPSDDFVGAGGSAVWDNDGLLLCQLGNEQEGIVMLDTETMEITIRLL